MRKIFIILLAVMVSGCAVQMRTIEKNFYDYRPYTSEGFFLSPNQYIAEHQPLGELFIKVTPALVSPKEKEGHKFSDGLYSSSSMGKLVPEHISSSELLEMAVSEAVQRGANGISNFSVKAIYVTTVGKYATETKLSHYEISGLCIKY